MNWNEFEASTIGQEPDNYVPSHFFSQTCGAVAGPGKRPGVAMVLGAAEVTREVPRELPRKLPRGIPRDMLRDMMKGPMRTTKNLYVLAEFESDDMVAALVYRLESIPEYQREQYVKTGLHSMTAPLMVILWGVVFFYLLNSRHQALPCIAPLVVDELVVKHAIEPWPRFANLNQVIKPSKGFG